MAEIERENILVQTMETRLYRLYDEIEGVENSIEEVKNRLLNIRQQKISEENVYQFLLYFDKLYDKFTDLEKKEFLNSFVEQVDIYEQEQPDGRFLKHIKFRFPVYFGDRETQELCWDNESTVETVVLMSKQEIRTSFQVETVKSGNSTPCECMANQRSERNGLCRSLSVLSLVSTVETVSREQQCKSALHYLDAEKTEIS